MDLSPFVLSSLSVLVVQSGVHAALSRRRPWVRIPSGTLSKECGLETPLQTMCSTWWWNWQTRSAQNAEPAWHWEFESPSGHCRWAGAQLAFIRPVGPVRVRDLQSESIASDVAPGPSSGNSTRPAGVREA